jgi:hypothetical protein
VIFDPRLLLALLALIVAGIASLTAVSTDDEKGSAAQQDCPRPYSANSPWNTPVPTQPRYHPQSRAITANLDNALTSDPTQYTYPVYEVGPETPRRTLHVRGVWSNVVDGGRRLEIGTSSTVRIPIPDAARAAAGSDAQIIIVDRTTGDEWGAWQLSGGGGRWSAENAYHYNVRWSGVPPRSSHGSAFGSRGAGVPYLTGLVRPCEIARGRIDHALAFAYDSPSGGHVYPATKSDGSGSGIGAVPEGTRFQLDPRLSSTSLRRRGCRGPCLTIARALQRYGMYVIDNSGRPKVMLEYEGTAHWNGTVNEYTVSRIPLTSFRVVLR